METGHITYLNKQYELHYNIYYYKPSDKPESRRAWEIVQGITFQGTEQGQGEWRVDLGLHEQELIHNISLI